MYEQFQELLLGYGDLRLGDAFDLAFDGLGGGVLAAFYGVPEVAFEAGIIHAEVVHRLVEALAFLDRVLDGREHRNHVLDRLGLVLRVGERPTPHRRVEHEKQERRRLSACGVVGVGTAGSKEIVRVHPVRQDEDLDLEVLRQELFNGSSCGFDTRRIAVVVDDDLFGES